jgi:tripartite-type tricarboxylate transporter receptor subunit TctC
MRLIRKLLMVCLPWLAATAIAQSGSGQNLTVVVPYTPGGSTDIAMRILQPKLSALLGQPVVIDYKPGAGGNIGSAYVAKSKPDGQTLLMQATIMGMYPHVYATLPFDPFKDLVAVASMVESPTVFVVGASSPYKTMADLVAEARKRPGGVNVASGGTGSPAHLAAEQLAKLNGFKITHIPYKGTAPVFSDLLGGRLDFASLSVGAIMAQLQGGQVRALVVASPARSAIAPEVPTTKEAGLAEMSGGVRFFLAAPAGTSRSRINAVSAAVDTALQDPDSVQRLRAAGFDVVRGDPDKTQAMLQQQYDMWGPIARELKLRAD